jgi:hypothetical protein
MITSSTLRNGSGSPCRGSNFRCAPASVVCVGTLSDLIELPGGAFQMGSQQFYPDEGPIHDRHVEPFAIEQHPVTNGQFSQFVADTGYVTVAERPLDPAYATWAGRRLPNESRVGVRGASRQHLDVCLGRGGEPAAQLMANA